MKEELYEPSLTKKDARATRSFPLSKLFSAAFLVGTIAVIMMGTLNALGLRLEKRVVILLAVICIMLLMVGIVSGIIWGSLTTPFDTGIFICTSKAAEMLMAFVYYIALQKRHKIHTAIVGRMDNRDGSELAAVVIIVGIAVEILIWVNGSVIAAYVLGK